MGDVDQIWITSRCGCATFAAHENRGHQLVLPNRVKTLRYKDVTSGKPNLPSHAGLVSLDEPGSTVRGNEIGISLGYITPATSATSGQTNDVAFPHLEADELRL